MTRRNVWRGLAVSAVGLAVGACAVPSGSQAELAAMTYVRALGNHDAVAACSVMSADFRSKGFVGDSVSDRASCEQKVISVLPTFDEEVLADFRVCGVAGVQVEPEGLVVQTDSRSSFRVLVIAEGGRAVVDDADF